MNMTKEEIFKEIDKLTMKRDEFVAEINEQIFALEEQVKNFDLTLAEKYYLWLKNEDEPDYVVYLRDSCPVFWKFLYNLELNRYQTYDISELFCEEFAEARYGDSEGTSLSEEEREKWRIAINELYEAGVTCFKYDW